MRKLNVLVVFDSAGPPPADQDYSDAFKEEDWYTEAAVVETLREQGHEVGMLGIYDDVSLLIDAVRTRRPDIVFNLTEVFFGDPHMDKNIACVLELLRVPFTGCGPVGQMLCNNKALSKKVLNYHRIRTPRFEVFRIGRRVWLPKRLQLPLIVKPLTEEASRGIAQASYVEDEARLRDRIRFIHEHLKSDAIAEEYVEGRELYGSVLGVGRLRAFPLREMKFSAVPDEEPKLATYHAKWDEKYRKKWGIKSVFADDLPERQAQTILHVCKRAYRMLNLDGYARFDLRLTPDGLVYILEANANPELAMGDEFAESAEKAGLDYDKLIRTIVALGLRRTHNRAGPGR